MRIFISWSGEAAARCAEALRSWLPYINPTLVPFVSSQDISKGERGLPKIANELKDCTFGIVCVTRENQSAPWINFEAGALSRELGDSVLAPFLLDIPVKDLEGPLTQFQATDSRNKEEVWSLVRSVNERCETSIEQERLRVTFDRFWGDLHSSLEDVRSVQPQDAKQSRDTGDILNELVALVREQSSRLSHLETKIDESRSVHTSNYTINEPHEVVIESDNVNSKWLERLAKAESAVSEIVGHDTIVSNRSGRAVSFLCTSEGIKRAQSAEHQIQQVVARFDVSVVIESTRDNTILRWHPKEEGV